MEFSYILVSLSLLFSTIFLLQHFTRNNNKKNLPPSGPLSLPVIGHLYLFKKPLHKALSRLSKKHGPALLLNFGYRRVFLVSSATLAEECFSTNDLVFADRPHLPSAKVLSYDYSTFDTCKQSSEWRIMRRVAALESLSNHQLQASSTTRSAEVRYLVSCLFRESGVEGVKEVELRPRLFGMSLNITMEMLDGRRYYGEDSSEGKEFQRVVEETFKILGASNIGDFLPGLGLLGLNGVKKRAAELQAWRDRFLQKLIDEHRRSAANGDGEEKKRTMIRALVELQKDDPQSYSDRMIKALIVTLILGGTETVSNTIEWAMSLLLNHPEYLQNVRDEIDAKVEKGHLLTESDLPNLSLLQCIIQETLRLYPVGPLLVPHQSSEDCTVGGFRIPRDTMLLVNAYAIHRDPARWEDPARFIPERFQDNVGSKFLIPFGMGRRRCPGEALAMRELALTLGSLVQCFEWMRVGNELVDMDEGAGLTMPKAMPLRALYRPRGQMLDVLSQL